LQCQIKAEQVTLILVFSVFYTLHSAELLIFFNLSLFHIINNTYCKKNKHTIKHQILSVLTNHSYFIQKVYMPNINPQEEFGL